MAPRTLAALGALAFALLAAGGAPAASISGTVYGSGSGAATPLAGMEVRLWQLAAPPGKGYAITATISSASGTAAGTYCFGCSAALAPGSYKVDVRMGAGVSGSWGDRWYDQAPPLTPPGGYVPEEADVLVVSPGGASFTGIDVTLDPTGGIDGRLTNGPAAGVLVRAELIADFRVHHNDLAGKEPLHPSEYSFRGLEAGAWRLFAHDPLFRFEDARAEGPFAVSSGVLAGPGLTLGAPLPDPYEGPSRNDTPATGYLVDPLSSRYFAAPHSVFTTSGAFLGPLAGIGGASAGDVDFYCFAVVPGDRFLLTATSLIDPPGSHENPFLDPTVAFFLPGATAPSASDDDSAPGLHTGAFLDTGDLVQAPGRACAAVSSFGDVGFTGQGNQSAGRYGLRIELGNRRPAITASAKVDGAAVAIPVVMNEAQALEIDAAFADPDSAADSLSLGFSFTDKNGAPVAEGTFTRDPGGTARFTWTPGYVARRLSPYRVGFTVGDGEFTATAAADVVVKAVNVAPTQPVQVSPASGARVATVRPALVIRSSSDVNQDPLLYEFEIRDASGRVVSAASVGEGGGGAGQTVFAPSPLPDQQPLYWRVRANDGHASDDNCCSQWTGTWTLLVDSSNAGPQRPQLVKPANGEEVATRAPALAATSVADSEGDPITLQFQVAADAAFAQVVAAPASPVNPVGDVTAVALGALLDWGAGYFARVRATDALGASSDWSDTVAFSVRVALPVQAPQLVGPFIDSCSGHVFAVGAPPTVQLARVEEPNGAPISFEVQLFDFAADPQTAPPLYAVTQTQSAAGGSTAVDLSLFRGWAENARYRVRARASDGASTSDWAACDFVLDLVVPVDAGPLPDAGGLPAPDAGADAGADAGPDGGSTSARAAAGCGGCGGGGPAAWVGLLALLAGARRQRSRRPRSPRPGSSPRASPGPPGPAPLDAAARGEDSA